MTKLLDTLTAEQLEAVKTPDALVHVSAGPGSGKTRVIAARTAWLLEHGYNPAYILILTFTRSACAEIHSRIVGQVGPVASGVSIWTFHEAALQLGPSLGGLRIATDAEVEAAIRSLYQGPMRRPGYGLPSITTVRSQIIQWEANREGVEPPSVYLVRARLHNAGLVPLWDLISRLLSNPPTHQYQHVLVDEAQDTTPSEFMMAHRLSASAIYSVGDHRQAIMGWRGADPDLWSEPTHKLTRTFRFGPVIAQFSNSLEVGPPIQGAPDIISGVMAGPGLMNISSYLQDDTAILTRTHSDAAAIAAAFPDQVTHIQRDPLDPLSESADYIAAASADGRIPALTTHSAKGREWDTVIVIGPSTIRWGWASEDPEEKRVLYVALTRARKTLILVTRNSELPGWRTRASGLTYKGNGEEGNS